MTGRTALHDRLAHEAARLVIRRYSTSFGLAARLLGAGVREHVENIYALVRIADEIVDDPGIDSSRAAQLLDGLEEETRAAIASGYSANLIVHAFGLTAAAAGFGRELTGPFFASMRMDLTMTTHDQASFERYIHGSAEVVGLMCLRVFLMGHPLDPAQDARMVAGAKALGAAFQKVNFLRDLAADYQGLGRSYFPDVDVLAFSEADKIRLLDDIDRDLLRAAAVIPSLPRGSRRAVALAHGLFAELAARLRRTPAAQLVSGRVRVPNQVKARIALAAVVRG